LGNKTIFKIISLTCDAGNDYYVQTVLKNVDFSEIENEHERKVAEFLNRLGFTPKKLNPIIAENKKQIGEIDSIFEYNDCLLLVEVSIGTQIVNEKKNFFFSKWSDDHNLEILRKQCELKSKKVKK